MAMALSRFSHWIWPGSRTRRTRELPPPSTAMANGLFPDSPSGFREPDAVGLPSSGGGVRPRKGKSRRHGGRGEARVDREHDIVIVPSDRDGGGGLSDSDSDGSDWSIGWLEPHAPELQSDGDSEGSFAVLVPCYRRGRVQRAGRPHGGFPGSGGADDSRVSGLIHLMVLQIFYIHNLLHSAKVHSHRRIFILLGFFNVLVLSDHHHHYYFLKTPPPVVPLIQDIAERIKAVDRAASMIEEILKQGQVPEGTSAPFPSCSGQAVHPFSASIFLGFDTDPSLNIVARIRGPNDQYINHIMKETGVTVVLRGKDSGNIGSSHGEASQPLHLYLTSMHLKSLEAAKVLAENLLYTIAAEFGASRIDGNNLRLYTSHWAPERWQEYKPLLNYCCDDGVKLVACGTPLEVVRTTQAEGIRGLLKAQRKLYAPPAGSGFISGFTIISGRSLIDKISSTHGSPVGPSSYLSAQARVVDDYTMSQTILKEITKGDPSGMLVVITGASHVIYGPRGIGVPARILKKMQKKKQVVVLLDPERQGIRREGEIPIADFLWYSAAKPCSRNCFDRAEIARVMNAARRRREALPQVVTCSFSVYVRFSLSLLQKTASEAAGKAL